jgi:hypothetical protein
MKKENIYHLKNGLNKTKRNNMKTLPTAEEFYIQLSFMPNHHQLGHDIKTAMIEFAKLHVEKALKEASEKVVMYDANDIDNPEEDETGMPYEYYIVDKNSILNAYSLTNIK